MNGIWSSSQTRRQILRNPQGWMNLWVGDQHKTNLNINIFLLSGDAMETGDWRVMRERERGGEYKMTVELTNNSLGLPPPPPPSHH